MVRVRLAQAFEIVTAGQKHSWCWLEQAGCGPARSLAAAGGAADRDQAQPDRQLPTLTSRKFILAVPGKHSH
jgi:hypothetical protein